MNFFKEIQQPVNESRLGIQPDQNLAEDWDSIPDRYKNDIEEFKKLYPHEKAAVLAKAHIIKTDGVGSVITKGEKWDNFWKRNEPIEIKTPYEEVDFDALYKKAKHDYAVLHSDREDELGMGAAGRRELQQRAEELAEMKRVTLRNERLHDEEVAFQRAETIQQRKDEMKKIADKYNHELKVINAEHSNNMEAIRTGNNHEINKMNMEYKHEKEMWDKNNPQEKPEYDDEEEYVKPQQSGNKFDQDTGEPIKPAGSQQSNQWHTSQQLTSPTKPTKPGKEDDDITDVEPKPNKPLTLGNNMKKESAPATSLPQKPLMAVSMDRWKQAVLNRYPNAKFVTQKMINGATIAMDETGQVGIYDPKNSYAKVGPTEDQATKQGVGEASKPDAYQRDEINATSGFGKNSYAYQMDGGANDEDHEGDRRREQQVQSGIWYVRINGKIVKDKQGQPYTFRGKAAANKAALTMQAKPFNQGKEIMLTTNPNDKVTEGESIDARISNLKDAIRSETPRSVPGEDHREQYARHAEKIAGYKAELKKLVAQKKQQGVEESTLRESDSPVAGAITRRILQQRHDLLSTYGPVKVMAAIDDVADFVGDTEEIGSSDVSSWIKQVEQTLAGMGEGVEEASLAQMRDYFNQPDDSMKVNRAAGTPGKNPAGIPHEIQTLVNKMYHSGKVTPEEFKILQDFQRKTKINVGIKEADTSTGNTGYDSMLAVMKAVDAGNDATFNLGGEPITLDYNEARFLAGRYKAFLKAGRQEEFLKYMENPVAFDRLMKQLRDLMDKQQNFRGSVPGERGVAEGIADTIKASAKKAFDKLGGGSDEELLQRLEKETGGKRPEKKDMPPVKENEYFCNLDKVVKEIPEGYKRTANGYITRI